LYANSIAFFGGPIVKELKATLVQQHYWQSSKMNPKKRSSARVAALQ
jgi:hypothetical protein